jgi:hypothetical protein
MDIHPWGYSTGNTSWMDKYPLHMAKRFIVEVPDEGHSIGEDFRVTQLRVMWTAEPDFAASEQGKPYSIFQQHGKKWGWSVCTVWWTNESDWGSGRPISA